MFIVHVVPDLAGTAMIVSPARYATFFCSGGLNQLTMARELEAAAARRNFRRSSATVGDANRAVRFASCEREL